MQMQRWIVAMAGVGLALGFVATAGAVAYSVSAVADDVKSSPVVPPTSSADSQTGSGVAPAQPADDASAANTIKEEAPIESLNLAMTKSLPPQYSLHVTYGLKSGCAKPGGYDLEQHGNAITVKVWALLPADPMTICTMIYGTANHAIPLGKNLTSGETYTVTVNDKSLTFTAQ